jgi:heme O synthase-like polyprenyltransferase
MATVFGILTILVLVAVPAYLIWMMLRSIREEQRTENIRKVWTNFGLSIVLCVLFFASWIGQAVAQWRAFVQEQRDHREAAELGEFLMEFGHSTLENWQSEFLQLFSFVVLAAVYVHHGSAESKDSEDRMEAKIDRIVKKLDA